MSLNENREEVKYEEMLLPQLTDTMFSHKIAKKRAFYENHYTDYIEGKLTETTFKERSDVLCNLPFNLSPHQRFVRNFMSFNTPYNSLLLYHGLGTGKTCSAMGICEEMRDYMKKIGSSQRIIVIASPNVQDNFKKQLFDNDALKKTNGKWNIESCVGTTIINEVLQHVSHTIKKDVLVRSIQRLIRKYYLFVGYQEFSNFFNKKILKSLEHLDISEEQKKQIVNKRIQSLFGNRLIVVDEAHNLRPSNKKEKGVGNVLTQIVENTKDMRLLLLSATPMYNNPQEIVWLINLMCKNDKIPTLEISEVFDGKGNLRKIEDEEGNIIEIGAQKLAQKLNGHISFVSGDNPFTFPFSLYPSDFEPEKSVKSLKTYPEKMMNGTDIIQQLEYLDCYMTDAGERQKEVYVKILEELVKNLVGTDNERKLEDMEGFGYNFIQPLIDALIICFPKLNSSNKSERLEVSSSSSSSNDNDLNTYLRFTGKTGLEGVMNFTKKTGYNTNYSYKKETLEQHGRIFSKENIGKYSGKIKSILETIEASDGIVMIYSQFLDGSLIPLAISLEEDGYERTETSGGLSMFSDEELKTIKKQKNYKNKGKYAFISGNSGYSPNNSKELAKIIEDENKNGNNIKVVLISRAGSEGLDFKNIRQLHILEPWYNTKRIEQIIGRSVRNCSHKKLPFEERNVSIYLHATNPFIQRNDDKEEPIDLYVYRYAERGAVKIGIITRILKETSIDCLINNNNMDFSADKIKLKVNIKASNHKSIEYTIGNKPYTSICDYMEKCSYVCKKGNMDNYNSTEIKNITSLLDKNKLQDLDMVSLEHEIIEPSFYENDISILIGKISSLYLEDYAFTFDDIHRRLKGYAGKQYSHIQLIAALNSMIENSHIKVIDNFGRYGNLVKAGDLYVFNPVETLQPPSEYFEIKTPVEFKHEKLLYLQPKKRKETAKIERTKSVTNVSEPESIYKKIEKQISNYIDDLKEKLDIAFGNPNIDKNEKNWYKLCSVVVPEIMKLDNISSSVIEKNIIHHSVDFDMDFTFKRVFVEYVLADIYTEETENKNKRIEKYIKQLDERSRKLFSIIEKYIREAVLLKHMDDDENKYLVCLFDENYVFNYYIFKTDENNNTILQLAKPEDINDFKASIIEFQNEKISKFADYVGFASVFKDSRITFKVKHMTQARSKGARCDQSGKSNSIALINEFRNDTLDGVYGKTYATKVFNSLITKPLCVYQELLLRNYNEIRLKGKIWFLPIEHFKQTNIESVTL